MEHFLPPVKIFSFKKCNYWDIPILIWIVLFRFINPQGLFPKCIMLLMMLFADILALNFVARMQERFVVPSFFEGIRYCNFQRSRQLFQGACGCCEFWSVSVYKALKSVLTRPFIAVIMRKLPWKYWLKDNWRFKFLRVPKHLA